MNKVTITIPEDLVVELRSAIGTHLSRSERKVRQSRRKRVDPELLNHNIERSKAARRLHESVHPQIVNASNELTRQFRERRDRRKGENDS